MGSAQAAAARGCGGRWWRASVVRSFAELQLFLPSAGSYHHVAPGPQAAGPGCGDRSDRKQKPFPLSFCSDFVHVGFLVAEIVQPLLLLGSLPPY